MEKVKTRKSISINFIQIIKGAILSVIISLIMLLIFALIIRFVNVPENIIMPINQVIKIMSLLIASLMILKNSNKGFIKGIIIGLLYALVSYFIFSILSGSIILKLTSLTDTIFCSLIGGLCGIIAVNIKKK